MVNCYVVTLTMRYSNPNISPIIDSSEDFRRCILQLLYYILNVLSCDVFNLHPCIVEEIRDKPCNTHQKMDGSSNVQSIVKEPVAILVRSRRTYYLAQVTVTVAGHKCTVFYIVSIARNTLAISTQSIIVWSFITPEIKLISTTSISVCIQNNCKLCKLF